MLEPARKMHSRQRSARARPVWHRRPDAL